MFGILIVTF